MIFAEIDRKARERDVSPLITISRIGRAHYGKRSGCIGADPRRSRKPMVFWRKNQAADRPEIFRISQRLPVYP